MNRSRMPSAATAALVAALLSTLLATSPSAATAQGHEGHGERTDSASVHDDHAMTDAAMTETMTANPHLLLTPARPASAEDQRRAADVAATLRRSIEKYHDVKVAEADGYRMFAPRVKQQKVLHFTSRRSALRNTFGFDPARPTSLLYERRDGGALVLIGAMYTAPRNASLEDLDRRIPLGVARWHRHVNICVPPRRDSERWLERRDGRLLFGPRGSITTREECDAAGGRFRTGALGWMVHANVFAGDDPGVVWADHRHAAAAAAITPSTRSADAPRHEP